MANPLLSSYRAGENRVTSSTMAVFERIDLPLVQRLLEAATGSGEELRTVTFENQVVAGKAVPDARISGRFTWWFETKTARSGYASEGHDRKQLRHHAAMLVGEPEARLFVLTPDPVRPQWFDSLDGVDDSVKGRVLWLSFKDLADAIGNELSSPARLIGEQTRFLLTELVSLYESDGLLSNDDTVIVAARSAWPEYLREGAYVCQPNRAFRDGLTHLGFYAQGAIQPLIAQIRVVHPSVLFTREEAARRRGSSAEELADLIEHLLERGQRVEGESYQVILLSREDDAATVRLVEPIVNDTTTVDGKSWGWTLSQRYTSLARLTSGVSRTSQLGNVARTP